MAYDLDTFVSDCRDCLRASPGGEGRERVRERLERLLADADFLAAHVNDTAVGTHVIYRDEALDFCVLVHVNDQPRVSPPHDHGTSWAVYGQVTEHTDMSEYRRVDGGEGDGEAQLELARSYRLEPGQAGLYDVAAIHAIDYPAGARFVRVTGTDLDHIPRLKYDLEGRRADVIESATVG